MGEHGLLLTTSLMQSPCQEVVKWKPPQQAAATSENPARDCWWKSRSLPGHDDLEQSTRPALRSGDAELRVRHPRLAAAISRKLPNRSQFGHHNLHDGLAMARCR